MSATLSQYPISASAFITEAEAQAACSAGTIQAQRDADAIMDGINWGASQMELLTGRNLKSRAYTLVKAAITVSSTGGVLVPSDSTSTAVLTAALVGEPVVSAHLPEFTVITRAWNGTNVAISTTGLGSLTGNAADSVIIGSARLLLQSPVGRSRLDLGEWPLSQLSAINLLAPDGTRTAIDFASSSIIDYDTGIVTLGTSSFSNWDDEWRMGRVEVECRAGYVIPSSTDAGHPVHTQQLASINKDLCVLHWQRHQTPSWNTSGAGAGQFNQSFDKAEIPGPIMAKLDTFMRRGR